MAKRALAKLQESHSSTNAAPLSGRGCHNKLGYPPCGARTAWKSRGLERRIPRVLKTAPSIQNSIWIYGANIHALVSVARGHVGATLAVL